MLVAVFVSYLLLALPVRGCVKIAARGMMGTMTVELQAAGIRFAREKRIVLRGRKKGAGGRMFSILRRGATIERIEAFARVGTGDAMSTALAASSVRAAAYALLAPFGAPRDTRVVVRPAFDRRCFSLRLRCIFSASAGDIMIAAAKTAMKKRRKEGV